MANELIAIWLDCSAEVGDRLDAAMAMADSDDPEVIEALLAIALDVSVDEDLADEAGHSLWEIWRRNRVTRPDLVSHMHPAASKFFEPAKSVSRIQSNVTMDFPALWIAAEGSFGVAQRPMEECSFVSFKNGFFEGLRFFDVSGSEWLVLAASPRRPLRVVDRLLNRRLELDIRMSEPTKPPISQVVERLCSCVDGDPDDLYNQFATRDELKSLFRNAETPLALITLVQSLGAPEERGSDSPAT